MEIVRFVFQDFWHWAGSVVIVVAFGCWFPLFGYTDNRVIHKSDEE